MKKEVKCFHCKELGEKDLMIQDDNYATKRYIHEECHPEYIKKLMVKCKYCNEKTVYKFDKELKREEGMFHNECYDKFLKEKAQKEKDAKELDELNSYLLKLFRVKFFNNGVYTILASVRNGDSGVLGARAVKSKQGYDYALMLEAFKYCNDDIEYALRTKDFNGLNNALKYIMYIVTDKLPMLEDARFRREMAEKEQERKLALMKDEDIDYLDEEEEEKRQAERRKRNQERNKRFRKFE